MGLEGFKRAFQKTFASNASNFDIRKRKVEAALDELDKAIKYLKSQSPKAAKPYEDVAADLRRDVAQAVSDSKKDAKKAFDTLDGVKKEAREVAEKARVDAIKTPMTVDIGKGAQTKVYPSDIPNFLSLDDERQGEVVQKVGEKISSGRDIVEGLISGTGVPKATRKEVSDVAWFLKAKAQEKAGEPYERGAMTLPDDNNRLRDYLDSCTEVYGRDSSHLTEQQKVDGGKARGIDFYEGVDGDDIADMDTLLPNGMRALLYQKVEVPKDGAISQRIYVKMETESARVSPKYMLKATFGKGDGQTPKSRPLKGSDVPRSIIHGYNLCTTTKLGKTLGLSQGEDKALTSFREKDVHPAVAKAFNDLVDYAKKNNKAAYKALKSGKPRLFQICANVKKLYDDRIVIDDDLEGYLMALTSKLEALFDDIEKQVRFGGEIVLNRSDMGDLEQSDAWDDEMVEIEL